MIYKCRTLALLLYKCITLDSQTLLLGIGRIFCDNKLVVINSSHPDSALKKKHCSIAYHKVREAIAAHKQLVYYEKTETNLADLLTKPLHHLKRLPLIDAILS